MYYFAQFRPDKKEAWRMIDERQLQSLQQPPAFMTVLKIDQDPEQLAEAGEDPVDHVKYLGPMFWDFDGPDIDVVLDDVRILLTWLKDRLEIDVAYIHCWLSGQKGVHITVPAEVWGVTSAMKILPLIYKQLAAVKSIPCLDTSVYSANRGRMWRCEGIPRPGTGTYKVGVTFQELMEMDADQYQVLVKGPRPPLSQPSPPKGTTFPMAESLFKSSRIAAQKLLRESRSGTGVSSEALAAIQGIPGCIEKLITEGDSAESNWNQAAMQLAAYIAGKYDRNDQTYMEELVEPFVVNVHSGSRNTERDRLSHMKDQLNRAFAGKLKFYVGALISVIGKPCGACPICNPAKASEQGVDMGETEFKYCELTKVKESPRGYLMAGENSFRTLTTFIFRPEKSFHDLEVDDNGEYRESQRKALAGTLIDDEGDSYEFTMPESAWRGRRDLSNAVEGWGTSTVIASDIEVQRMLRAIMRFSKESMDRITRTPVCGLLLERKGAGVVPHYVEAAGSCTQHGIRSRFVYTGKPDLSPTLMEGDYPYEDDEELHHAITGLVGCNEDHAIAAALGWAVACHFREHFHHCFNQFPLLNLSGNAESGKSSLAFLLFRINGMDYTRADYINCEVSSVFPILKYLSSSTTVPRLMEEFNPANIPAREYVRILGLLKAAWNRAPIPRGFLSGKEVKVTADRVSAPIVFASEQCPDMPAIKSRTVEVKMTSKALNVPEHTRCYRRAVKHQDALLRLAKALVTKALHTSPEQVKRRMDELEHMVSDEIGHRPKFSYQTCLFGLAMLEETLREVGQKESADAIADLLPVLPAYLNRSTKTLKTDKRRSEVDKVLIAFGQMAETPDDLRYGLQAGIHYWRQGDMLYINLHSCMPRYLRYARGQGETPVIRDDRQMAPLLEGETYFDHLDHHPSHPSLPIHVINLAKAAEKGNILNHVFQDETEAE